MSAKVSYHTIMVFFAVLFNSMSDITNKTIRLGSFHANFKAFFCHPYQLLFLRRCLANSCMLSSDVSAGFDPTYASSFEKKNAAFLGGGLVFNKFTGSRGKSGSNDANAEYIAEIRKAFEEDKIIYHTAELGKVDVGGGGTIAYILALYGMNVIDSGVAVLNMHAPWEVISKADLFEAKRGYVSFLKNIDFRNE